MDLSNEVIAYPLSTSFEANFFLSSVSLAVLSQITLRIGTIIRSQDRINYQGRSFPPEKRNTSYLTMYLKNDRTASDQYKLFSVRPG